MTRSSDLPLDARVRDTPRRSTSFVWPSAVSERLDWLVETAIESGEDRRLSRTDLLCALIVAASADGIVLRQSLEQFRLARVRDLVVGDRAAENVVSITERRPGPRRRA